MQANITPRLLITKDFAAFYAGETWELVSHLDSGLSDGASSVVCHHSRCADTICWETGALLSAARVSAAVKGKELSEAQG